MKQVNHTYSVGDYAYVLPDSIYCKLKGDKLGPYRITEVFTNNTVRIQKGIVNERINIRRLTQHFGQPPNWAPYQGLLFLIFWFLLFLFFLFSLEIVRQSIGAIWEVNANTMWLCKRMWHRNGLSIGYHHPNNRRITNYLKQQFN